MIYLLSSRLWHRCGEGCSSGSSLPVCDPCEPAYGTGVGGPRETPSIGQGTAGGTNQTQTNQGISEGDTSNQAPLSSTAIRPSVIKSHVDDVPGGVQIQRGGSLPNPVASSMLGNTQSGPGGRASSLSSSQASRSPTDPVQHTATSAVYNALVWKMNERGPTGTHTPAALASLAELLSNPSVVPGSQPKTLDTKYVVENRVAKLEREFSEHISVQKNNSTDSKISLKPKAKNIPETQRAKVRVL